MYNEGYNLGEKVTFNSNCEYQIRCSYNHLVFISQNALYTNNGDAFLPKHLENLNTWRNKML